MNYYFIINGRENMETDIRADLERQLAEIEIPYRMYTTTGIGDGTRFIRLYCDLNPHEEVCFVACGGSGTSNEVASGIINQPNKSMAILAYGHSNDLIKCYPGRDFHSVKKMLAGQINVIDSIRVNDSYAINVCNIGFDAEVASEANYQSERGNKDPYKRGILRAIFLARYNRIRVYVDGERINRCMLFLCTFANGRYTGGDFLCAPNAKLDDGLIDVCLLKPMSLLRFLLLLPHYKRGEHLNGNKLFANKLVYRQAKYIEVKSSNLMEICLDGELLPGPVFYISIVPQSVRLVIPEP